MANLRKWTDEQLIEAVKTSISYSEISRKLGISVVAGNFRTIKKYMQRLNLSAGHLLGQAHGTSRPFNTRSLDSILVDNSTYNNTTMLKKRLVDAGILLNHCYVCNNDNWWKGKPLVLVLDHINGKYNDNRKENLRLVCPNCNSQLPTFCRGDRKSKLPVLRRCAICNAEITEHSKSGLCSKCAKSRLNRLRNVNKPTKEELEMLIKEMSWTDLGKKFHVSDNAVKKWVKQYGIEFRTRPYIKNANKVDCPCSQCGKDFYTTHYKKQKYCSIRCKNLAQRKTVRPSKEELELLLKENSLRKIAKKFGVSHHDIIRWATDYEIDKKVIKQNQ